MLTNYRRRHVASAASIERYVVRLFISVVSLVEAGFAPLAGAGHFGRVHLQVGSFSAPVPAGKALSTV